MPNIVIVRDRNQAKYGNDIAVIDGKEPFVFARNVNVGLQYFKDKDVIVCNDDIECNKHNFFNKLYAIAFGYPDCGMMSPLIKGGVGNALQDYYKQWNTEPKEVTTKNTLCFPCVVISRRLINKIGLLDENFVGYGFEDADYCIRAYKAGFPLMITKQLYITHGNGTSGLSEGLNYSLSFAKETRDNASEKYFKEKYPEYE